VAPLMPLEVPYASYSSENSRQRVIVRLRLGYNQDGNVASRHACFTPTLGAVTIVSLAAPYV